MRSQSAAVCGSGPRDVQECSAESASVAFFPAKTTSKWFFFSGHWSVEAIDEFDKIIPVNLPIVNKRTHMKNVLSKTNQMNKIVWSLEMDSSSVLRVPCSLQKEKGHVMQRVDSSGVLLQN